MEQFTSLDKDEDFVTLSLPLEGPTIEYFAERVGYSMPFTKEAYKSIPPHGPYCGEQPMKNYAEQEVVAYDGFSMQGKERYQKFRKARIFCSSPGEVLDLNGHTHTHTYAI